MSSENDYEFLDQLFLRSPFYSPDDYAPERIREVLLRRDFRNALWLASPDFFRVLQKQDFDWELLGKNVRISLLKYYNRMSFRATPFGAFSAFSLVPWDVRDEVRLTEPAKAVLHLLPSWEWARERQRRLKTGQGDWRVLTNPTLMALGDRLSFVRSLTVEAGEMQFSLNSIPFEELNKRLTDRASEKPVLRSALIRLTMDLTGCTKREASGYVDFLVREQVLLTEFDGGLIGNISGKAGHREWDLLTSLPFTGALDLQQETSRLAGGEFAEPFKGNLLYGGLERPVQQGGIAAEWREEILSAIRLLRQIVIPYPTPALKDFASRFRAKFEGQKVPLLTALDPDTGVGYNNLFGGALPSELLRDLPFPASPGAAKRIDWTGVHRLFFRLWQQNTGRLFFDPLVIRPEDLEELGPGTAETQLPPSLAFLFSRTGGQLVLDNNGGASATAILGRFSIFSPAVRDICRDIAAAEARANPGVIFAELHQLSGTHVDNINRRSPVYDHVIPVNTYGAGTGQAVIALNDLVVSVQGEDIVLESVTLGKRVIPRLPTAYNFHHNQLAVFRFLGDLQYQGLQANLTFDLEKLFPGMDFYPRVAFEKVVISLAKWRLSAGEIDALTREKPSISVLHLFRQRRGIPSRVTMGISDQQLVFELADDGQALFFLDCLKGLKWALIRECLEPDRSLTAGKQKLAGQFIALLTRRSGIYKIPVPENGAREIQVKRVFVPGSEWIYWKIYCTEESADHLLLSFIRPFIAENASRIKSWFFIRYYDPEPHIRLRILTAQTHYGALLKALKRGLSKNAFVLRVRSLLQDTYRREIERYSAELIGAVEACFCAGSELATEWLSAGLTGTTGAGLCAFRLVYQMAVLFIDDQQELAAFFSARSNAFIREFGDEQEFRLALDRKYRTLSTALGRELEKGLIDQHDKPEDDFKKTIAIIAGRSREWTDHKKLQLAADLIHMQVNRLFSAQQRQHEALIWFCLSRYTISALARKARD